MNLSLMFNYASRKLDDRFESNGINERNITDGNIKDRYEEVLNREQILSKITSFRIDQNLRTYINSLPHRHSFLLKTNYPGVLPGSGYPHGMDKVENDTQIGFFFDYTTGLPCFKGSSVKGVLRSKFDMCPDYIVELFRISGINISVNEVQELTNEIFEGKNLQHSEKDIFLEAFAYNHEPQSNLIGYDYITPHKDPIKNPTPIKFLKVMPGVTWKFMFNLKQSEIRQDITPQIKITVFKTIIIDWGIGAKTRVGYGNFTNI